MPLGSLALTERFVHTDPIAPLEYEALVGEVNRQLDSIPWLKKAARRADTLLVGIGGTIRNLARIEAVRQAYPLNTLHGFSLNRGSVAQSIQQLRELSLAKRRKISGLNSDRADIILPGAVVIHI